MIAVVARARVVGGVDNVNIVYKQSIGFVTLMENLC